MTWSLIRDVYDLCDELDAPAKAVLVALAFRANRDAVAWPRLQVLAADTGLGERSIRNALGRLVSTGRLVVIHNAGHASSYLVTPASGAGVTPASRTGTPASRAGTPASRAGGRRTVNEPIKNASTTASPVRARRVAAGAAVAPVGFSTASPWVELPDGTVTRATS